MRECKIGVGGCGGNLYKTFLEYSDELVGHVLKNMLGIGAEKELVKRAEEQWVPLFSGLWLDMDRDDVSGLKSVMEGDKTGDYYNGYYYLYNGPEVLTEDLARKMVNLIGYRLDAPGFIHRPELQMIAFANPEISRGICSKIYENMQRTGESDSLFFFVGLGGGTGTGVISNLAGYISDDMKSMKASFVLGILTGKHDARNGIRTQATFFRRCFNAIWALSDLVSGEKVACVTLMDNDKISEIEEVKEEIGKRGEEQAVYVMDRYMVKSIFPWLGKDELEQIDESELKKEMAAANFTPIYVPCYWHGTGKLEDLVKNAIAGGKLADCDHTTAEGAYVFTKGFMDKKAAIESIVETGLEAAGVPVKGVRVWRTNKVGWARKDKEVLIILKNPGIKNSLAERVEVAINFVRLIEVVERVETGTEDTSTLETLGASLKEPIERDVEGKELLEKIKAKIKDYLDEPEEVEKELITVIANAWETSHAEKEFKFTEKAIKGNKSFVKEFREELEKVKERIENGEKNIFQKHVKIYLGHELGYLFSIDAKFCWDMVPGSVSDNERLLRFLKDDLNIVWADRENAEISKINDGKTIRISNKHEKEKYAEITLGEKEEKATLKISDGGTRNLKVKKEDGELKNIYDEDEAELVEFLETPLFSMDAGLEEDVNKSIVSEELRNVFGKSNKQLFEKAKITRENGDKWKITDEVNTYIIRKEAGELNIYEPYKGVISGVLKKVFEKNGVTLLEEDTITQENVDEWMITSEKEKRKYIIKKEAEKLNIYEREFTLEEKVSDLSQRLDEFGEMIKAGGGYGGMRVIEEEKKPS